MALLSAEGATVSDLARDLGIGVGTIMSIRRHIKNKLGLPARSSLDDFLPHVAAAHQAGGKPEHASAGEAEDPDPDAAGPADSREQPGDPRRQFLVLRQAICEVERLSERLSGRADAMAGLADMETGDDPGARWQIAHLRTLATGLSELRDSFLASVRQSGPRR